jgi:hypothetical protein
MINSAKLAKSLFAALDTGCVGEVVVEVSQ